MSKPNMESLPLWSKITLMVVMFAGIGVLVHFQLKRRRENEVLYKGIKEAIRTDVGVVENEQASIDKKLITARCDGAATRGYDASDDAAKLIEAQGGLSWTGIKPDDDEAIFAVLRGKSGAQMKCLDEALNTQHGISLSEYIEKVYGDYWDADNQQKAIRIINAAK